MTPRQGHLLLRIRDGSVGRLYQAIPATSRSSRRDGPSRDEFTRCGDVLGCSMLPCSGEPTSISLATGACSGEGPGEEDNSSACPGTGVAVLLG